MGNKSLGTVSEYNFFSKVLELGYDLFIPAGDYLPQDCVVGNSAGKLFKVQIKGTYITNSGNWRYKITAASGSSNKIAIDCTKVDLLAVHVAPHEAWYLIPCLELEGQKSCWFYPNNPDSKGQFESYRENWDYFKQG